MCSIHDRFLLFLITVTACMEGLKFIAPSSNNVPTLLKDHTRQRLPPSNLPDPQNSKLRFKCTRNGKPKTSSFSSPPPLFPWTWKSMRLAVVRMLTQTKSESPTPSILVPCGSNKWETEQPCAPKKVVADKMRSFQGPTTTSRSARRWRSAQPRGPTGSKFTEQDVWADKVVRDLLRARLAAQIWRGCESRR